MNYLKEILAFHSLLEINQLDSTDQALWYHLMHINNKCGWAEWFTVANMSLQARLGGVDKKTIDRHRNNLINAGLIEYKNQGKKQAGKYRIISLVEKIGGDIGGNIPLETSLSAPYLSLNTPPLNKDKDKQKDNIPPLPPKKEKPKKIAVAEFVYLTPAEHERLIERFGEADTSRMIEILDNYIGQNPAKNAKRYTDHNRVIQGWVKDRLLEEKEKKAKRQPKFDDVCKVPY